MAYNPAKEQHVALAPTELLPVIAKLIGLKPEQIRDSTDPNNSTYPSMVTLQYEFETDERYGVKGKVWTPLASFSLKMLDGCCGTALSFHAAVNNPFKKQGLGRLLIRWRAYISYLNGFRTMLCTTQMENKAQCALLESEGFKCLHQFTNFRTSRLLGMYLKDLTEADGRWDEKSKEVLDKKAGKTE
jgi:hypothetical protein